MPEYLSKEEVKQWRSSLEKITLEEYAARLGKVLEEDKKTNDLIDIVLKGQPVMSKLDDLTQTRGERLSSIAQRTFEREKELSSMPFSATISDKKPQSKEIKEVKEIKEKKLEQVVAKTEKVQKVEPVAKKMAETPALEEVKCTFNKALTDREQLCFDFFAQNKNTIVYAKDLAKLLDLPRDYVYKYIKNLRSKIEGDKLKNADNGGYMLTI